MPIVLHIVDHVVVHVRYPEVNFYFGTLVNYVRYGDTVQLTNKFTKKRVLSCVPQHIPTTTRDLVSCDTTTSSARE